MIYLLSSSFLTSNTSFLGISSIFSYDLPSIKILVERHVDCSKFRTAVIARTFALDLYAFSASLLSIKFNKTDEGIYSLNSSSS